MTATELQWEIANHTIERCAKAAEAATIVVGDAAQTQINIAADIRALKDQPLTDEDLLP